MGVTFRKNAIVVGAGASKEFGLPTGVELAEIIAQISNIQFDSFGTKLLSGSYDLVETLRYLEGQKHPNNPNIDPYLHAAWHIRDNMPLAPSIDNFLDTHRDDELIVEFGKVAICHAIQKAEATSKLAIRSDDPAPALNYPSLSDTWLTKFFKILVAQRTFEDFIEALRQITFISFNYDRCIHQFFYYATKSYFNLDSSSEARTLEALKVIYPYGSVGEFSPSRHGLTNFGEVHYRERLISASKRIKTFTEGADSDVLETIRSVLQESELVMFLGFGFLQLNMELLFQSETFPPVRVLGTGKGLSRDSISEVETELSGIFEFPQTDQLLMDGVDRIKIVDCRCGDLFHEYQRYLTR